MLKGFIHTALSFLLLFATTGLAVSKHFCGEHLFSTSLFTEADPCCNSENCCHNDTEFYQVTEKFLTPELSQMPHLIVLNLLPAGISEVFVVVSKEMIISYLFERNLPPAIKTQTFLSHIQAYIL